MKKYIALLLIISLAHGCASSNGDAKRRSSETSSSEYGSKMPTAKGGGIQYDPEKYIIKKYDTNRDKKPDRFTIFEKVKDGEPRIFAKQMDLNSDGKIDVWRFYDKKGSVMKEELDVDFDGNVDEVDFYLNGIIIRRELDSQFDEKTDIWKYYDEKGNLNRLEEDQNYDGTPDYWEYYANNVITRIEKDTDMDGKADIFKRQGDISFSPIIKTDERFVSEEEVKPEKKGSAEVPDTDTAAPVSEGEPSAEVKTQTDEDLPSAKPIDTETSDTNSQQTEVPDQDNF